MTVCPLVLKVHRSELENTETESAVKMLLDLALIHLLWLLCVVKRWVGWQLLSGQRRILCAWCVERECHIALCYIMMKYWVYDLVKFLSCPAQIAFHNLMRQIFFNGNPGRGHDCHDKLRIQLLKAGMHTLVNASCDLIGLKSAF